MSFTGPNDALQAFGVTLIGVTPDNGRKLLLTLAFIIGGWLIGRLLKLIVGGLAGATGSERAAFWARQAVRMLTALIVLIGVLSIWFDDPTRLAAALGLVTAGLAFALQRVVTAVAGYFVILRGKTFNVGDRIVMGGVRGDVIGLDFMQTTIMEMGQPPPVQNDDPAVWVQGRQYTGRIVTVTNAKIFDEPVYNYTRDFGFLFEEMTFPIKYTADRAALEEVLLDVARRHAEPIMKLSEDEAQELQRRYFMSEPKLEPRVYWRMTDNWLELTVRFVTQGRGVRDVKDAMTREILARMDELGIEIASATFEIVGLPTADIRISRARSGGGSAAS